MYYAYWILKLQTLIKDIQTLIKDIQTLIKDIQTKLDNIALQRKINKIDITSPFTKRRYYIEATHNNNFNINYW